MLRQDTTGKDSRYKFFWVGNNQGTSGVGVLAEKWVDKVYDMKRVSDRIMLIKLLVGEAVLMILSIYAPQTGLEESTKDAFYDSLQTVISELPDKEIVIPVETGMDTLDEKQLDMKVFMEVLGMANVM